MTRKEDLQQRLEKLDSIRNSLKKANEDWLAYNQEFNSWIQKELGINDIQGEMHLAEILMKWDANDNSSKLIY